MSFTYQQVIDDADIKLRNVDKQNWDADIGLSLLNDAIQYLLHAAAFRDPDQYATSYTIPLLVATGYGPYDLPAAFKHEVRILDDQTQPKPIVKINKVDSKHGSGSGRPSGYWLQGRNPTKIYFNMQLDVNRNFTLEYIAVIARQSSAGLGNYVPLEPYFFEVLVQWLVKFAGDMDEYLTMTEAEKIKLMNSMISGIVARRANPPRLTMSGISGL